MLKQKAATITLITALLSCLVPSLALASTETGHTLLNLGVTHTFYGFLALFLFVAAYLLVMLEELTELRKSKPVILAAGFIWIIVCFVANREGLLDQASAAARSNLLEFTELFLFLFVAMTYVNAMEERKVFEALRVWLVKKGFNFRQLFWITGILAFFISPIADNLTTALLMCAVVMAIGSDNPRFISLACINIVVAANAGGAFSPFGDITTLMVWQKGILPFHTFFSLFIPAVINFMIPALIMHFAVPKVQPAAVEADVKILNGGKSIMLLFLLTIATTVLGYQLFHVPPAIGMMTGLGYLQFFAYYLKKFSKPDSQENPNSSKLIPFDIFRKMKDVEWDTLLFFYGVMLCIGGLATLGYLNLASQTMYGTWGAGLSAAQAATPANASIGVLAALIGNIPVMFSVLTMHPVMSEGQWLLVTFTAGVGGSLLAIGSAAGVALLGQTKGMYTFFSHLKWTWAIALGYIAAIAAHLWLNAGVF